MVLDPARPKNTYTREDKLLPHLPALHLLLTTPAVRARRRTRAGADVTLASSPGEVIGYLREHEITLTWNPASAVLQARGTETAKTITVKQAKTRLRSPDQEGRERSERRSPGAGGSRHPR